MMRQLVVGPIFSLMALQVFTARMALVHGRTPMETLKRGLRRKSTSTLRRVAPLRFMMTGATHGVQMEIQAGKMPMGQGEPMTPKLDVAKRSTPTAGGTLTVQMAPVLIQTLMVKQTLGVKPNTIQKQVAIHRFILMGHQLGVIPVKLSGPMNSATPARTPTTIQQAVVLKSIQMEPYPPGALMVQGHGRTLMARLRHGQLL